MKRVVTGSNASTASVAHDTNLFGGEGVIGVLDACYSVLPLRM
jgi:hypothetical protein